MPKKAKKTKKKEKAGKAKKSQKKAKPAKRQPKAAAGPKPMKAQIENVMPEKAAARHEKIAIGPYNAGEIELSVLDFWKKNHIHAKANRLAKQRSKETKTKTFYFLDGPPYTSGKVHIGTAWNKALKDSIIRYKRMKGVDTWDRAGYDMHGLPTEHATEKKLGIKNKDEILTFGIAKFIEECKNLSVENMKVMNDDFMRLGVWMDFDNAYQSIKDEFIEGEWWLIKKAHENNRLYQGKKTMHWCAHDATALAKHELEYKEITDNSIFFKFRVEGTQNEYLVVWTTTPWTLAFNLAVMVNPELDYVKCEVDASEKGEKPRKETWIISKALAGPVVQAVADRQLKIIEEFKGSELKGLKYLHPWLDDIPSMKKLKQQNDKAHTVVMSQEYVDISAGSGLVHCAPGCGPEDYEVGIREKLPAYNTIDEQGVFPEDMGIFKSLVAKEDDHKFIDAMREKGALIAVTPVEHDYAHCWRCHNPVIFRTTMQWFFKIEDLKENMKELNKDIYWVPDWAGSRQFHSWLDNLRDNSITKQRFWGTPLPVWMCGDPDRSKSAGSAEKGCGNYVVVGDKAELKRLAGKLPKDLHKPWIDEITISCNKCGKQMKRIPDILDVWVDAGCVSWICLDYPQRKELFDKMFPADFILEGKDQIRGWFNLLFVASMVSMEKPSFKSVYMHGYINDAQGRKMSKSLGNYILPEEVISKYGADSFRYYSIGGANAGNDLNYNFEDVSLKHKNLNILWNMHKFLLELKDQGARMPKNPKLGLEEKYILSKMNSTIKKVTDKFEKYNLDEIPAIVENLYLELSRTYIQLVRDKSSIGSDEDKQAVFYAVYTVMIASMKMMAPLTPFITERMFQNLKHSFGFEEESVHLLAWPHADEKMIDERMEQDFDVAKAVMQSILAAREKAQLGIRWPLKEAVVVGAKEDVVISIRRLEDLIKTQTNVKKIQIVKEEPRIKVKVRADYKKIAPDYGEDTPKVIAQFAMTPTDALMKRISMDGHIIFNVDNKSFKITKEHLMIEKEAPKNLVSGEFRFGDLYIDTTRTEELEAEGYAREIMRRVQQLRKEAGLKKPDRINLCIKTEETLAGMLSKFKVMIKDKVGADEIRIVSEERLKEYQVNKDEKIKGKSVKIGFDRG